MTGRRKKTKRTLEWYTVRAEETQAYLELARKALMTAVRTSVKCPGDASAEALLNEAHIYCASERQAWNALRLLKYHENQAKGLHRKDK
jgi:hypothetical protein